MVFQETQHIFLVNKSPSALRGTSIALSRLYPCVALKNVRKPWSVSHKINGNRQSVEQNEYQIKDNRGKRNQRKTGLIEWRYNKENGKEESSEQISKIVNKPEKTKVHDFTIFRCLLVVYFYIFDRNQNSKD